MKTQVLVLFAALASISGTTGCYHASIQATVDKTGKFSLKRGDRLLADYNYSPGAGGPESWHEDHKECGGDQQSPINVPLASNFLSKLSGVIPAFAFDYDVAAEEVELVDKGTTVEMEYHGLGLSLSNSAYLPYIVGRSSDSNNSYTLEQFHFHWGATDHEGSEHTFDGKAYPLEMHLVHYNSAKYANISEAVTHDDGLLVVAVFFDVVDNFESVEDNAEGNLQALVDALEEDEFTSENAVEVDDFDISDFVSDLHPESFYLYPGSLTTPGCFEVVTWVLLKDPLHISTETMEVFRNVLGHTEKVIERNFRPIQDGNGRQIYDSTTQMFATLKTESSTSTTYESLNRDKTGRMAISVTVVVVVGFLGAILAGMHFLK